MFSVASAVSCSLILFVWRQIWCFTGPMVLLVSLWCDFSPALLLMLASSSVMFIALSKSARIGGKKILQKLVKIKSRTFLGCQHLQLFEFGIIVLSIIGYYNRNWHDVQIGLVLVGLPFMPLYFYLPSSYKWVRKSHLRYFNRRNLSCHIIVRKNHND